MDIKHTPGPWIASDHFVERRGGRTYIPVLRPGNDPVPVAVVHIEVDGYGRGEGQANARLIAAAPDMLAALRGAMVLIDTMSWPEHPSAELDAVLTKRRTAVLAAIAKAAA
jgi:hypothetical protein